MTEKVGARNSLNHVTIINLCSDQSVRCFLKRRKVPLAITLTFLLIHVTIVSIFGEEEAALEDSSRWKRSAGSKHSPPNWVGVPQFHRSRDKDEEVIALKQRNVCITGHIQGMRSVCRDQLCLHQLKEFHGYPKKNLEAKSSSVEKLQHNDIHRHLQSMEGILDSVNYPLLSLLVDSQKHLGALGSVGLIQTRLDKFSSFLASSVEQNLGEKLVVVHPFNNSIQSSAQKNIYQIPTYKDIYTDHLIDLGFSNSRGDRTSKEFHLIDESTPSLPKTSLSELEVPQFRIISLSSDTLDPASLLSGLESAACNLRDGGLVILNFDGEGQYSLKSLKFILENKFGMALSVVVATFNKIFIASTNWKSKYVDLILENSLSLRSGLATFDTATGYYRQL